MEPIGNLEDMRAVQSASHAVDSNMVMVLNGIMALKNIHEATNVLVNHEGKSLSEVLQSKDVLRTYVLATLVELAEFIQVLPWKPWRDSVKTVDGEKLLDEFADILAFIGVLITILDDMGYSPDVIVRAYIKKEYINIDRFVAKMGGVHYDSRRPK